MFNFKILIFPKNTPWGVVRKADGTLQYKHVLRFETDALRDEFVNTQLFTEPEQNYKTLLESEQERRFDFLSDTRVHFRFTPPETDQFNQIRSADFAVAKINNEYQFFALKVLKTLGKTIFFEGELDLFFTYKISFRPESQNFVARAHLNRLTPDGTKFKVPTYADFPELFYAPEPFDLPLTKETTFPVSFSAAPSSIYWVVFWAVPQPSSGDNSFLLGQESPYLVFFFPFSTNYRPGTKNFKQCRVRNSAGGYTNTADPSIYDFLQKNPFVKKIIITPRPPLGFQENAWDIVEDDNFVTFTRYAGLDPIEDNYGLRQASFNGVRTFFYEVLRLDASGGANFTQYATANFFLGHPADIKLLSPQFTRVFLKNFFDDEFEYGLPFVENVSPTGLSLRINHLSTLAMENPKSFFWIDETTRNNLLLGNLLEVNYLSHMPLNTDLSADYLLKNKNQIQTQLQQSRFNRNMTIANSVFKGLIGAAAVAAAPFTGGASLGAAAGVGIGASGASTVVGAASSALSAAKTHEFTKQRIDSQLADLAAQPKPIRVAGEQIYDIFTLPENLFFTQFGVRQISPAKYKQVSDFLNMFGYQLNKLFNLNSLLSNRKFWNFIQANDVFNSLNLRLSSPQKQIISNAFAEGLTFWHYRNATDWQGVLSFGRENWETNYNFPSLKKTKKRTPSLISQIFKKPRKNAKKSGLKIPDATRVL